MTSATAKGKGAPSKASELLEYALGKKRISLDKLSVSELQTLLREQIESLELKELHGFRELKSALSRNGDEPLLVDEKAGITGQEFSKEHPFGFKSQVISVGRGVLFRRYVYRRHESDEQTEDPDKVHEWGRTAWLYYGQEKRLFLRRLPDSWRWEKEELLVEVFYTFTKVPNERKYLIGEVSAKPIPISSFYRYFRKEAPSVARELLWELHHTLNRTVSALEHKLESTRKDAAARERLANSIG